MKYLPLFYIESNLLDNKVRSRNLLKLYAKAEVRVDVDGEGKANKSIVATAKILDTERMNMRRRLFESQDAIDAERDKLIKNAEKSLQKPVKSQIIFAIDWRIV